MMLKQYKGLWLDQDDRQYSKTGKSSITVCFAVDMETHHWVDCRAVDLVAC